MPDASPPPAFELARAATAAMVLLGPLATVAALRPDLLLWSAPNTNLEGLFAVVKAFIALPVDLLRASAGADPAGMNARLLGFIPLTVGALALVAHRGLAERRAAGRKAALAAHGLVIAFGPLVTGAGVGAAAVVGLAIAAAWALTRRDVRAYADA